MVRYNLSSPPVTGAIVPGPAPSVVLPWQPSTWPETPSKCSATFIATIRKIFDESILSEINNVIADAGGNLQHRGHVVAIALLCALDAISSYGYGAHSGGQIPGYVQAHFSANYQPHAAAILRLYRHAMVHSWNLFEAAILPGSESVTVSGGVICFGLLDFRDALSQSVNDYLSKLGTDPKLQKTTLLRYRRLKASAKS